MTTRHDRVPRRARPGFTLIELLIVIAILLAIGGLVVVNLIPRSEQAKTDLQSVQLKQIASAIDQFRLDMDRLPTEEEGIEVLWDGERIEDDTERQRYRGPYLTAPVRADRWGNVLAYRFPGEIRGEAYYDLVSFGPDGEEGTDDDLTNHDNLMGADGEIPQDADFGSAPTSPPAGAPANPGG